MFQARDFIITREGLVFAVTLNETEAGRVVACLRYAPTPAGLRKVSTHEAETILRTRYPRYLYHSPRRDALLHAVPINAVETHLCPRQRLRELLDRPATEPLIDKLQRLVDLFEVEGLSSEQLGVTGSLLIGLQHEASDLDLVVYGREPFAQARRIVRDGFAHGWLQAPDRALWRATYQRRGCALSFDEYLWHEQRKYNKGAIDGTKFDLILMEEKSMDDDPRLWYKLGRTRIRAPVIDAEGAFATPARYRLDHPEIPLALCFTATYLGQAEAGERVEISGHLEQASDGERRIVVGTSREAPEEYIKVIPS
ncbi:MAG: nucleotidyltransferase domain-containing protein [Methylohalobius crimeensis]